MAGKGKQRKCRICKKRPAWRYKNCPPGVCKRCYHKDVWVDRPAARKERSAAAGQQEFHDPAAYIELWEAAELLGDGWEEELEPTAEVDVERSWGVNDCPF